MRVMITGAAGLLGAAITSELSSTAEVRAFDHTALDITDAGQVSATVAAVAPDAIVNCAAYNGVDAAEDDAPGALSVNTFGVLALARAAAARGAVFVHYSSGFVFDGESARPYVEEDTAAPKSVYGASKLLGDWFALDLPSAYVLRIESVFGPSTRKRGSLVTIVSRIRAGEPVPVFVDRTVSPTYTADVAAATHALLIRRPPFGLYHCVNAGSASWDEVAKTAAEMLGLPFQLTPITLETAGLRARRPRCSALSPAKLAAVGIEMPTWRDALARYLATL